MTILRSLCLPVFLLLAACSISLTPDYDPALHDGLNDANKAALTLFSALSGGSSAQQFSKHEAAYNDVIGTFGALLARAKTRPEPVLSGRLTSKFNKFPLLDGICAKVEDDQSCTTVTPRAISEIVETLSKIRDRHKSRGVSALVLEVLVGDYELSMEQALTVEAALK
ncbi:MAG: hypothetical protein GY947_12150 [Rhodobacteraceae bacterium]|nr:hypothetical protein [Paracoccaceae bacterium]